MEKKEYEIMYNIEDDYWWYAGLRELVFSCIEKYKYKKNSVRVLDAGCGTGKIMESCQMSNVVGLDMSEEAIRFCKLRGVNNLIKGSLCNMPFKNNSFNIVISLDVLYHLWIEDDVSTLKELYRILDKNGILVLNLVAFNFLRSTHDDAVYTRDRYTVNGLTNKVEKAGFTIDKITYRNTFLFPLAVIMRITKRFFHTGSDNMESDLKSLPRWLNKLFTYLLLLENMLIKSGFNFPFGLSLFCIVRKKI